MVLSCMGMAVIIIIITIIEPWRRVSAAMQHLGIGMRRWSRQSGDAPHTTRITTDEPEGFVDRISISTPSQTQRNLLRTV